MSVEIVPWICREEWEICRDNLFGEDLVMKKKAVEHLHIWKTRCLNLPVAVECTLILMDTHLQGMQLSENETRMLNLMNLELMYSMAVTKFVNFVTDCGTRSSNTLQDFAKELGIPAWIVDLRHKAAHCSSASSLPLLREAVEFCLKWLYDEYWTNADFEDVCNVDENSLIDVENYFDIYLIIKKHVSNDIQFVSQITEEDRQKIYRNFCKTSQVEDFERLDNWSLNETCTIILKKLSKIFKKNPRKGEQLVDKLLEDDSLISPSTLSDTNELNDNAVNTWTDIISVLCASKVSHYLLSSLIKITNDEMELTYRKKGAAIYLNEIFKNILQWKDNSAEDNNEESKKSKKKKKKRYDIEEKVSNTCLDLRRPQISHEEVSALLKLTLERPSVFVTIYLKSLLMIQKHSIPPTEIDKLLELVAIYNGHTGIKQLISDTRDHSLRSILGEDYESQSMELVCEDTPQSIITSIDQVENQDEADSNINDSNTVWKKCSNDWKWSQTPFGVLPWQEEFKPWLQLYQV